MVEQGRLWRRVCQLTGRGHFDHAAFWDALSASRRVVGVEARPSEPLASLDRKRRVSYFPAPKTFNSLLAVLHAGVRAAGPLSQRSVTSVQDFLTVQSRPWFTRRHANRTRHSKTASFDSILARSSLRAGRDDGLPVLSPGDVQPGAEGTGPGPDEPRQRATNTGIGLGAARELRSLGYIQ